MSPVGPRWRSRPERFRCPIGILAPARDLPASPPQPVNDGSRIRTARTWLARSLWWRTRLWWRLLALWAWRIAVVPPMEVTTGVLVDGVEAVDGVPGLVGPPPP